MSKSKNDKLFIGVDPGLVNTGISAISVESGKPVLVAARTIRTDSGDEFASRLLQIREGFVGFSSKYPPGLIAIEEIFSHPKHPKTAIIMAHARGVIIVSGSELDVPIVEIPARRVKQAIAGTGAASKSQIRQMVCRHLNISELPGDEHVADATAIAITAIKQIG